MPEDKNMVSVTGQAGVVSSSSSHVSGPECSEIKKRPPASAEQGILVRGAFGFPWLLWESPGTVRVEVIKRPVGKTDFQVSRSRE